MIWREIEPVARWRLYFCDGKKLCSPDTRATLIATVGCTYEHGGL